MLVDVRFTLTPSEKSNTGLEPASAEPELKSKMIAPNIAKSQRRIYETKLLATRPNDHLVEGEMADRGFASNLK